MSKTRKSVVEIIKDIANPIAENLGLELWDIKFLKEGSNWYLRVFIDNPSRKITIEDCENMSRALDAPLDELDPIEQTYCLEVCSPGIERELSSDDHLKRYIGHDLKISLFNPQKYHQKNLFGKLVSFTPYTLTIKNSDEIELLRKDISKINLNNSEENAI